jgi:hypothetical protein
MRIEKCRESGKCWVLGRWVAKNGGGWLKREMGGYVREMAGKVREMGG